jgi:hypothetical protein
MDVELLVKVVVGLGGVLGGGKFIYDMFTVRAANKKTNAEGSVILVDSASSYAQTLVSDLLELRTEFNEYRKETDKYRRENDQRNRRQDELHRAHARWDMHVQHQLHLAGVEVPDPPPLLFDEAV